MKHRISRAQVAILAVALTFAGIGSVLFLVAADGQAASGTTTAIDRNCDPGTDGCVSSYRCSDGIDNDGDGYTDMGDPGCSSSSDDDESPWNPPNSCTSNCGPGGSPAPQCNDKVDNDGDGKIDYPADLGCSAPGDNDEYNATPPPPPPPPPPPTTTTTAPPPVPNGDPDLDGYCTPGIASNPSHPCSGRDNCPNQRNADQADDDGDSVGNVCDPTPFRYAMAAGGVTLLSEQTLDASNGATFYGCSARWKLMTWEAVWKQSVINNTFLKAQMSASICYKPLAGILWVKPSPMKATYSLPPWTWQDLNNNGFPSYTPISLHTVEVNWQGKAAICAFGYACGGSKLPWVTFHFSDDNSGWRSNGVG